MSDPDDLLTSGRVSAALVFPVAPGRTPGWSPGPLPVSVPGWVRQGGWAPHRTTGLDARLPYFSARTARVIYGDPHGTRWHQARDVTVSGGRIVAVEVLRRPRDGDGGLAVVHVIVDGQDDAAVATLGRLARMPGRDLMLLQDLLPTDWAPLLGVKRGTVLTFARGQFDDPRARWALASSTPRADFTPTDEMLPECQEITLSDDWGASVLRDGVFFGVRPGAGRFAEMARLLVHTLYLDVVLLSMLQRIEVERLEDALAATTLRSHGPEALISLEDQALTFRTSLWSTTTGHQRHANALLRACHVAHELPERVALVAATVSDAARLAGSALAARTSAALAFVSLVGAVSVPLSLAYSAVAILAPDPTWRTFAVATLSGAVVAAFLCFALPIRHALRLWARDLRQR